ncbi:hypothetical protein [Burkholderia ubonensis]|nr:hypothetical protein [Burkholderia ubonensis]
MKISEPLKSVSTPDTLPVLQLGLRPFHAGGALFGSVGIAAGLAA